jgi:four helix bundle protein
MKALFDHDRLEVYQAGRDFNRQVHRVLENVGRGHADSKNQLKRAAKSITRNIAEGSGKWSIKDKVHFYHIARGSATECAAELDALVDYQAVRPGQIDDPRRTLSRVVGMIVMMIRSLEARAGPDMSSPAVQSPRAPTSPPPRPPQPSGSHP